VYSTYLGRLAEKLLPASLHSKGAGRTPPSPTEKHGRCWSPICMYVYLLQAFESNRVAMAPRCRHTQKA